ncbi:M56 family metallopeptidase [Dactylosporangium sp. NBC_01737]|uniref:M56 family metallopeptidase n=1 Tax=Dactylosporangium sp. NBC_01737 TaxID=2975959 RepID=UPI002E0E7660|nr:M56 family metallopeptidase [Dactylosporangium sp. NBC_01737]
MLCALGVVLAAPEELVRARGADQTLAVAALFAALTVAAVIVVRLLVSLGLVVYRSRVRRARHRMLADLLDRAEERAGFDDAVRVLDGGLPFAYCVPGRSPRIVLSQGTLRLLSEPQVAAVLAHERAHLRARHDVVMESFTAFYRAVPGPLRSRAPLDAVHILLEALADDAARRRHGTGPLREALRALGGSSGDLELEGHDRDADQERRWRLDRLAPGAPATSRWLSAAGYTLAAAILVLPTVLLVVPWLGEALRTWPL